MNATDLSWRTDNIGRVLFSASYVFVQDELRAANADAPAALSQAQMALFRYLDGEATGLTQVAARAKMTKQAMLELVDKAERLGLVYRRNDPQDRRARHVAMTAAGADMLRRLGAGEAAAEARLAAITGSGFVATLKAKLSLYIASMDEGLTPTDHLGRALHLATDLFVADAMRVVWAAGHDVVRDVHMALYRNLDLGGTRLTVLAQRAQMTRQAMRELVDKTEALGFVERLPDPHDRRAKTIRFTKAGLDMLGQVREGIAEAESGFERITGKAFVREAKDRLSAYVEAADPAHLIAVDQPGTA